MIHDISITLQVAGKPDVTVSGQCPDCACYDACEDEFLKLGPAVASFRRAERGKPTTGSYTVTATAMMYQDGVWSVTNTTSWGGVSATALAFIEGQLADFCDCASAKKAKAVKR